MTTVTSASAATIVLKPSYRLPGFLAVIALAVMYLQLWLGLSVLLFSIFLLVQTATLRLHFTPQALEIYRGESLIRRFPYADWQNWRIFWSGVPILFYFKEVKSIHFLPILFDPTALRACLETRCPRAVETSSEDLTP